MKVIVGGLAIEYEDEGVGKTMFFLHGWQDNLHTFDALAPLLSSTYRVIRLDLPGFGKSEMPKEAWDLNQYVQCVLDFIQKLNLHVDTLAGHSFGGRIIIKGASTKVFQPYRIVLIGSAGTARRRTLHNVAITAFAKVGKMITYMPPLFFLREKLKSKLYRFIGSDYLDAGVLQGTFLKIISEDLSASAVTIAAPTLLIWGRDDMKTPLFDGERLSRLIHNSELKVINGAGHFVHQEKSQEVARLIQAFVC